MIDKGKILILVHLWEFLVLLHEQIKDLEISGYIFHSWISLLSTADKDRDRQVTCILSGNFFLSICTSVVLCHSQGRVWRSKGQCQRVAEGSTWRWALTLATSSSAISAPPMMTLSPWFAGSSLASPSTLGNSIAVPQVITLVDPVFAFAGCLYHIATPIQKECGFGVLQFGESVASSFLNHRSLRLYVNHVENSGSVQYFHWG